MTLEEKKKRLADLRWKADDMYRFADYYLRNGNFYEKAYAQQTQRELTEYIQPEIDRLRKELEEHEKSC